MEYLNLRFSGFLEENIHSSVLLVPGIIYGAILGRLYDSGYMKQKTGALLQKLKSTEYFPGF